MKLRPYLAKLIASLRRLLAFKGHDDRTDLDFTESELRSLRPAEHLAGDPRYWQARAKLKPLPTPEEIKRGNNPCRTGSTIHPSAIHRPRLRWRPR